MRKFLAILALCCAPAWAQSTFIDTSVPGTYSAPITVPGAYHITIQVVVSDAAGTTATQAALSVVGGVSSGNSSGRGGGAFWFDTINEVSSVALTASDGSQPVTFTPTSHTQTSGRHRSWTSWAASGKVPVGTYSVEVDGTLTCLNYRGPTTSCQRPPGVNVTVTTTFTQLPITYWWTTGVVDLGLEAFGIEQALVVLPVNVSTYAGDKTGPQRLCDLYDTLVAQTRQQYVDAVSGPGRYQIDFATSTPTLHPNGTGSCTYTLNYQDLVNSPGVEQQTQTPSGIVSFASGPQPFVFSSGSGD